MVLALFGVVGCTAHRPRVVATEVPPPAAHRATGVSTVEDTPRASASLPAEFTWPITGGKILAGFGVPRASRAHAGIDIGAPAGHAVTAAREGRVVHADASLKGYGKTVIIDHGEGVRSLYAHNSELLVTDGQWVDRGQPIARVGRTGNATTEHCHFEIRMRDVPVDPMGYLSSQRGQP
jgi:murein DD-endopeptidase MepM/ murein hydrolase activator NlpD